MLCIDTMMFFMHYTIGYRLVQVSDNLVYRGRGLVTIKQAFKGILITILYTSIKEEIKSKLQSSSNQHLIHFKQCQTLELCREVPGFIKIMFLSMFP
jgi:hypothetical protein